MASKAGTFKLQPEVLLGLRNVQKGQPLQGLLVGSRIITREGIQLIAKRSLPYSRTGQDLATLINLHLSCGSNETVLGWFLLIDKECSLPLLASSYFNTFLREYIRTVVANLTKYPDDIKILGAELVSLLEPMTGLIIVRAMNGESISREFCGYRAEISLDQIISILYEHQISKQDLLSGANVNNLPCHDDLDCISKSAIDELMDQLRAEELESPQSLAKMADDINAFSKGVRKTRRRRASNIINDPLEINPNVDITNSSIKPIPNTNVFSIPVEVIPSYPSEFLLQSDPSPNINLDCVSSFQEKETILRNIFRMETENVELYSQKCREYELLTLIFKVLSQPDDILIKKLANVEEYEERMKKLSNKLKHSLSPEDLLNTLASIQIPTTSNINRK